MGITPTSTPTPTRILIHDFAVVTGSGVAGRKALPTYPPLLLDGVARALAAHASVAWVLGGRRGMVERLVIARLGRLVVGAAAGGCG